MAWLDPLDREILERAFDAACSALKDNDLSAELDSDERLEAALRRELVEVACLNGVSDPETLRDLVLENLSNRRAAKT
jgi:hypothetical protein